MEVTRITAEEFEHIVCPGRHVYNSVEFTELNRGKCDSVHYLAFHNGNRVRAILVAGERHKILLSPFSAPFGGFICRTDIKMSTMIEIVEALKVYAASIACKVRMTLPPDIYDSELNTKTATAMATAGAAICAVDINYHCRLDDMKHYIERIDRRARNKLRMAVSYGYSLERADPYRAYAVIKANREAKGYRLSMTLDEVEATARVVETDFFVLTADGRDIAAAQIAHTAPRVAQVIYWGEIPDSGAVHAMNMLAYMLMRHYASTGYKYLDLGPASDGGRPLCGLCDFKESIGGIASAKYSFSLDC